MQDNENSSNPKWTVLANESHSLTDTSDSWGDVGKTFRKGVTFQEPKQDDPLVQVSFRVPRDVANRLKKASLERKLKGNKQWSAAAIAAEALDRFLKGEEIGRDWPA
jgi:formylglycine-generating enzyme required for sulfatase activity